MIDIYRYMIEASSDIVFLLDTHDKFIYLNDSVESLTGFNKDDLMGKSFSLIIEPDDRQKVKQACQQGNVNQQNNYTTSIELRFLQKGNRERFRYFDVKIQNIPTEVRSQSHKVLRDYGIFDSGVGLYGVARDVSHLKSYDSIIYTNANYDFLTGLPNRYLLKDRLKQAIAHAKREKNKFAVMYLDLDGFKQVNDVFGHSTGDAVLQNVSNRMKSCLREADTLARIGGDEFIVLLPDINDLMELHIIARKLLKEINKPYWIREFSMPLSVSIGVALYPDDGETFDEIINGADRAMYHIKHRSKNNYAFMSELPLLHKSNSVINFI